MDSLLKFTASDIDSMKKVPRLKLVNSLSGFKSANLIGTRSPEGIENLAMFSSVIHLGSNPPLLGCILRPTTVPRHTYDNLKASDGWFTVNHVHKDIYEQAHQTSGNYREDLSEFEQSGLTPCYTDDCPAPYVEESRIRIGLQLQEEHLVEANGTRLLVAAIREVWVPEDAIEEDHGVNIEQAGTVAISGTETYHDTSQLQKLSYVRIDKELQRPGL